MAGQDVYYSVDDVKEEWQDYTRFQKQELISFANFLYSERFFDRALLSYFQYLYRFPGDSLEPVVYYHIARCYEKSNNPKLAYIYYRRVLDISDSTSIAYRASQYREIYLQLQQGDFESVLVPTEFTQDPYLLVMRGYLFLQQMDWKASRQAFMAAEERFQYQHYSDLLAPIFQAIDNAAEVPLKNKWLTALTSIVPGGGQAYLNQWNSAAGTIVSTTVLLALAFQTGMEINSKLAYQDAVNNFIPRSGSLVSDKNDFIRSKRNPVPLNVKLKRPGYKIIVPPLVIGAGVYLGSIWRTINDVEQANLRLVQSYVSTVSAEHPLSQFMDFPEPEFTIR